MGVADHKVNHILFVELALHKTLKRFSKLASQNFYVFFTLLALIFYSMVSITQTMCLLAFHKYKGSKTSPRAIISKLCVHPRVCIPQTIVLLLLHRISNKTSRQCYNKISKAHQHKLQVFFNLSITPR